MKRTTFIRNYADKSGIDAKWAILGFIQIDDHYLIAMPCNCRDKSCEGWAMVSPSGVESQLSIYAPEPLLSAYRETVSNLEK